MSAEFSAAICVMGTMISSVDGGGRANVPDPTRDPRAEPDGPTSQANPGERFRYVTVGSSNAGLTRVYRSSSPAVNGQLPPHSESVRAAVSTKRARVALVNDVLGTGNLKSP